MNDYHTQLLKAAKAIRNREERAKLREATDEHLDALVRSSPLWAAIPGGLPAAGAALTDEQLNAFVRHCQIAESLGIEC